MTQTRRSFASDNVAPAAPEVMSAIAAINHGTMHSYGDDAETRRLTTLAQEVFECELVIHPVATGTAANALALATLVPPFGGVYCHEIAHINTDECGAPEFFSGGAKLLALPSPDGKLSAAAAGGARGARARDGCASCPACGGQRVAGDRMGNGVPARGAHRARGGRPRLRPAGAHGRRALR